MVSALLEGANRMQEMDPTHPFSWVFQANIHHRPTFPDYVYPQATASKDTAHRLFRDRPDFSPTPDVFGQGIHHNWWFLPWHRAYVYYFERILRWACGKPEFTLPYWDYTAPGGGALPDIFRVPTLDDRPNALFVPATAKFNDGSGNPREFPMRSATVNGGDPVPDAFVSSGPLALVPFSNSPPGASDASFGGQSCAMPGMSVGMGGALEALHEMIHAAIGGCRVEGSDLLPGFMVKPETAARDPIFWVLHTNVDRLWSSWLASGGGRTHPRDSEWLNQDFRFYDVVNGEPKLVTVRVDQLLNTESQLGYTYDRVSKV